VKAVTRKVFRWIAGAFEEPNGGPSAMRIAAFLVAGNVMLVWTWLSISGDKWQPMGWDMIVMVLSVLGIKAAQRAVENRDKGGKK
jgi:hypothetical protein